jgi:hypothetical protein
MLRVRSRLAIGSHQSSSRSPFLLIDDLGNFVSYEPVTRHFLFQNLIASIGECHCVYTLTFGNTVTDEFEEIICFVPLQDFEFIPQPLVGRVPHEWDLVDWTTKESMPHSL